MTVRNSAAGEGWERRYPWRDASGRRAGAASRLRRAEGQDGLDGIADGVRAVRLQLVEAAGVVIASDEEIRGRSQKDGQQGEELVVDVADDQLVRLGALLQDIQVLR